MKLKELADRVDCRLEGDGEIEIRRVAGIQQAQPGDLTFVANAKYAAQLADTRASAVILAPGMSEPRQPPLRCAVLRSADPYSTFARALDLFVQTTAPACLAEPPPDVQPHPELARPLPLDRIVAAGEHPSPVGRRTGGWMTHT